MKLTKLQRHTAYIIMLTIAESGVIDFDDHPVLLCNGWGLCHLIYYELGVSNANSSHCFGNAIRDYFPELESKLSVTAYPPRTEEGWQQRIELLKQCIAETA